MYAKCALLVLVAVGLLSGCNQSASSDAVAESRSASVVMPQPASGEGCNGVYGNHPSEAATSVQGLLASLYPTELACGLKGGEYLTWEDAMGTPREACLQVPDHATPDMQLPLLTFLHGSIAPGDPQVILSGFDREFETADLSGDPNRPGYILLMVEGRDKPHHYPFPDDHAWGYDNWYRNFDRADPNMNVDAATVDHFIAEVEARGIVDSHRKYMSGWSNGAAMAMIYALNTPGIAASAVYSSPDPFSDVQDPCAQTPFGTNLRPIMTIHNDCDIIGICTTGNERMLQRFTQFLPQLEFKPVIIDALGNNTNSCNASCEYSGSPVDFVSFGTLRHLIWPTRRNEEMYTFLRERPLPE